MKKRIQTGGSRNAQILWSSLRSMDRSRIETEKCHSSKSADLTIRRKILNPKLSPQSEARVGRFRVPGSPMSRSNILLSKCKLRLEIGVVLLGGLHGG
jgi:hypothetical protein